MMWGSLFTGTFVISFRASHRTLCLHALTIRTKPHAPRDPQHPSASPGAKYVHCLAQKMRWVNERTKCLRVTRWVTVFHSGRRPQRRGPPARRRRRCLGGGGRSLCASLLPAPAAGGRPPARRPPTIAWGGEPLGPGNFSLVSWPPPPPAPGSALLGVPIPGPQSGRLAGAAAAEPHPEKGARGGSGRGCPRPGEAAPRAPATGPGGAEPCDGGGAQPRARALGLGLPAPLLRPPPRLHLLRPVDLRLLLLDRHPRAKSRRDQTALCAACCLLTSLCDTVGAILARQLTIQVFTGAYLAAVDLGNFVFILFPVCGSRHKSNSGRGSRERNRRWRLRASVFALALPLSLGPGWALWATVPKASGVVRGPQRRLLGSFLQDDTEILGYLLGGIAALGSWASRMPPLSRICQGKTFPSIHLWTRFLSALAGLLYASAIVAHDRRPDYLLRATPWFLTSLGRASLDLAIIFLSCVMKSKMRRALGFTSEAREIPDTQALLTCAEKEEENQEARNEARSHCLENRWSHLSVRERSGQRRQTLPGSGRGILGNADWVPLMTLPHCKPLRTMAAISRYMELTIEPVQEPRDTPSKRQGRDYLSNTGVCDCFANSAIKYTVSLPALSHTPCRQAAAPPGCPATVRRALETCPSRSPPRTLPFRSSGPACLPAAPPRCPPPTPTSRYTLTLLHQHLLVLLAACPAARSSAHRNLTPVDNESASVGLRSRRGVSHAVVSGFVGHPRHVAWQPGASSLGRALRLRGKNGPDSKVFCEEKGQLSRAGEVEKGVVSQHYAPQEWHSSSLFLNPLIRITGLVANSDCDKTLEFASHSNDGRTGEGVRQRQPLECKKRLSPAL
ncbi:hypothetical protein HPG69_007162 [Diceros bicornis minor]|uniref:Transmembrane protein 44 n=1 Tax=Diceros bicornis minor TaxID=77932 RepID=A0A7J7F3C7_DICBM|nr:hypothetical protein HPG69_007162 [Diceros bicornis minor]